MDFTQANFLSGRFDINFEPFTIEKRETLPGFKIITLQLTIS